MKTITSTCDIDRRDQPERHISEGLAALGKGIAWAGFWLGLGLALRYVPAFIHIVWKG
jgi:hypothetical protein